MENVYIYILVSIVFCALFMLSIDEAIYHLRNRWSLYKGNDDETENTTEGIKRDIKKFKKKATMFIEVYIIKNKSFKKKNRVWGF